MSKPPYSSDPHYNGPDRRADDGIAGASSLILHRLGQMERGMTDMHASMKELAQSMSRLAVAEERIGQVNEALGRGFKKHDKTDEVLRDIDTRIITLEKAAPINKLATDGVFKIASTVGLAVVAALLVTIGLKP